MISAILLGFAKVSDVVLNLVWLIVLVSVIISWVNPDPYNPVVKTLRAITEPMYRPFRGISRRLGGPLDLAPMFVMLIIIFLQTALPKFLVALAVKLG